MKNLLLGLALTATTVGGSALHNSKTVVTSNFLIQPASGLYIQAYQANGSCLGGLASTDCKYLITDTGRWYIPNQTLYFWDDINYYYSQGWIQFGPDSIEGIYLIL